MAGEGTRFKPEYEKPKPLIEFDGKPMIEHVLNNLGLNNEFILCVRNTVYSENREYFEKLTDLTKIQYVLVDKVTEGPASTVLLAKDFFDHREMLMVANCDQMMVWDQNKFEKWFSDNALNGAIFTFYQNTNEYSYAEVDSFDIVLRTAEKEVISNNATTGIYVWEQGHDLVWAIEQMIKKNKRAPNGEFYIAPAYNEVIEKNLKIMIYEDIEHYPIGTPNDLKYYINLMKKSPE